MTELSEHLDLLDEHGVMTGKSKLRAEVHRDGDWHVNVHVWLVNNYGDLLLQKRAEGFYLAPHFLDVSMSGHVQAGHTSEETAVKEAEEELGITIPIEQLEFVMRDKLSLVGSTEKIPEYINNEFRDVYVWKSDLNPFDFKFDTKEMSGLELVTQQEFGKMIYERDQRLVPQWKEYETVLWYLGGNRV